MHKLVTKWKVALPLHAELGTQPNVYYVPPLSPYRYDAEGTLTSERRIPDEYLVKLFGPRVPEVISLLEAERERKRRGEPSELMDLLIAYRHEEMFKLDAPSPSKPGGARLRVIPIVAVQDLERRLSERAIAAGGHAGGAA